MAAVTFDIIARDKASQAFKSAGQGADGLTSKIGGLAKLAAGAFAGASVAAFAKGAVDAARESNKVAAQTAAVIKSTGGAANLTAKQFGDLATAISNKTGVDDEAVQSASNLLATFTNIHDQAGKNNDIFSQATKVAVDMGAALKNGPAANSILVGKALNDPIKGLTALTRVGVSFDEQQKKQIKSMVAAGDTMGAQKVILAELNKEFGGSAEAVATPFDKLKVTLGNLQEDVGNKLIPVIDRAASFFAAKLPAAIDKAGKAFAFVKTLIEDIIGTWNDPDVTSSGFFGAVEKAVVAVRALFDQFRPQLDAFVSAIGDNMKPILIGIAAVIVGVVVPAFAAWAVSMLAAIAPVVAIVAAVALVVVAFQKLSQIDAVRQAFAATIGFLSDTVGAFVGYVQAIWPQVSEAIGHVLVVVEDIVRAFVAGVTAVWSTWGDDIARIASGVFSGIRAVIDATLGVIRGIIQTVLALINGDWGKAWDGLKQIVGSIFGGIKGLVKGELDVVVGFFGGVGDSIRRVARGMFDGVKDAFIAAINWIIRAWNGLEFKIPGFHLGPVHFDGFTLGVPDIPLIKAASGFHGLLSDPTLILAGEAGLERVDITPGGGGHGDFAPLIGTLELHGSATPDDVGMLTRELRVLRWEMAGVW